MIDPTLPDGRPTAAPSIAGWPARYRIITSIALGGQGQVVQARDTRLNRDVVVKVLYEKGVGENATRAEREIAIMARLQHRGIVAIYDAGNLDDGRLWYAMRQIRGRLFNAWISPWRMANGRLDPAHLRPVVQAVEQICRTVGYAHGEGIVHRDLKPANIMVEPPDVVQVLDWGVAGGVDEMLAGHELGIRVQAGRALTQTNALLGTPHYMAPEQLRAGATLPTVDVYAMGVVLYEALSGRRPYGSLAPADVLQRLPHTPPPPITDVVEATSRDLADLLALIERAMAHDHTARPRDCAVLADELAAWIRTLDERRAADEILADCAGIQRQVEGLLARQRAVSAQAKAALSTVAPYAPVSEKAPGWALEEQAAALDAEARALRLTVEQRLHIALNRDRANPRAHRLLAQLYRDRSEAAEVARQHGLAEENARRVAHHDRAGEHRAWCAGTGGLTLVTEPAGARVTLHRVAVRARRLLPDTAGTDLGRTPLQSVAVRRGAYVARVRIDGQPAVTYPLLIERGAEWVDRSPDGIITPVDLRAARPPTAPDEDAPCFVPAGWFRSGGDPLAPDGLPASRSWTDAFFIDRFAVSNRRYLTFINDLAGTDIEAARRFCPRRTHSAGDLQQPLFSEVDGVFDLPADGPLRLDMPVYLV